MPIHIISESGTVWGHFRYHAIVMLRQFCDLPSTFKMVKCFYFLGKWWSFTNLTGFGKFFAGSNHITNSTNLSRPSLFSVFCWVKLMQILEGNCHGLINRGKLFRIRPTSKVRPMAMTSPTLCMAEPGGEENPDDDDRRVESWFTDVLEELLVSKPYCGLPGTCVFPTCWNTSRSTNINVLQLFSNFKSQTSGETNFSARSPLLRVPKKYLDIIFPMFRCSYSYIPCILLDASGHPFSPNITKEPMRQSTVENFWRSQRGTWGGQQPSIEAMKTNHFKIYLLSKKNLTFHCHV